MKYNNDLVRGDSMPSTRKATIYFDRSRLYHNCDESGGFLATVTLDVNEAQRMDAQILNLTSFEGHDGVKLQLRIGSIHSKEEMPKYQKLLNAFDLPLTIWLEFDGNDESDTRNRVILDNVNDNKCVRIPTTLEDVLGHTGHFGSTFKAKKFFEKDDNINDALEEMAKDLFTVS